MKFSEAIWVLLADGSRARIFQKRGSQLVDLGEDYIHTESRLHGQTPDKPGKAFESAVVGSYAYEPRQTPHEQERQAFVAQLAEKLEEAYKQKAFTQLIIAASPETLGELRKILSPALLGSVKEEFDKDITHLNERELTNYLEKHSDSPIFMKRA